MSGVLVALGLGSNQGDSRAILEEAIADLGGILSDLRQAPVRETAPLYVMDQPPFLNTAVCGCCSLSPRELLDAIHRIEAAYGRDRSRERRWGERTLDIDILLYGDLVVSEPDLEIPHPRLMERPFALDPLNDCISGMRNRVGQQPLRGSIPQSWEKFIR
jgi:2-amino-4-hydroxy-6-hydroxymethyldihydropteridine diphosphokinase